MIAKKLVVEIVTLSTPRGRVIFAVLANSIIFTSKYQMLGNLSLYQRLGLDWVPSIGLTRAYWLLLHGDFVGAWERNWLIFPVMMIGWSIVALDVYKIFKSSLARGWESSSNIGPSNQSGR